MVMLSNRKPIITAFFIYGSICTLLLQYQVQSADLNELEEKCVNEMKLNKTIIETWNIEPLLPEDNSEIRKYMTCYWKKMGYQKEDGEIDYLKLGVVVHNDLKERFHSDCQHIVAYIVDTCKNSTQADTDGLRAIRMWNCLNIQTENLF